MSTTHTPGPWRIDGGRAGPNSDRLIITHGSDEEQSPIVAEVLSDYARLPRDANARLIAAAPDLLAALEGMIAARERTERDRAMESDPYGTCYTAAQISGMWGSAMLQARAAIAKVRA